ncbi:E3 ubiquitin-protein ligase TRIM71-like [Gigantopelta aegis]|uniref:E3 ubiquitin-protein ligase TRIM71-like n=1 Tax=Gigantopelta aegis TaxID=1735272 RepID=UPI001B88A76E|nr:E3 ubiquitin-protein ligase TRIM71-like [Gigantopelta aegis]
MSSMGSQFLRAKIEDDYLTCAVCQNSFTKPKALPCLHSFCEGCLRDYVESRGYQDGTFPCLVCRQETQMPANGVQGFPDNHIISSLSDTVNSSKTRPVIPPRPAIQNAPMPKPRQSLSKTNDGTQITSGTGTAFDLQSKPDSKSNSPRLYPELPDSSEFNPPPYPPPQKVECASGLLLRFGKFGGGVDHLCKPFGLATAKTGEIIVSDHGGNRILIYSSGGHLLQKIACDCIVNGLAVTQKNNILVTVNKCKSAIMRVYSINGRCLAQFGEHYRFENPCGVAVMSSGYTTVTGLENMCIYLFTEQYKFSQKLGRKGSGDEHFLTPYFVATDSKDHIIVSDSQNNCIQMFNSMGKFKRRFGVQGSSHDQLFHPLGVCVDKKDNIIVADSDNHRVEMFNNKGKYIASVVRFTSNIGPSVRPTNVAITPDNKIVVLLRGTQFAEIRVYQNPE